MKKNIVLSFIVLLFSFLARAKDTTTLVVYFDFNKWELNDIEREKLTDWIKLQQENVIQNITIIGHTDQIGSHNFNNKLSQKRAEAVAAFFTLASINEQLITVIKGEGKRKLITNNTDASSRKLNRRVTIVIASKPTDNEVTAAETKPPKPELPIFKETSTEPPTGKNLTETIKDSSLTTGNNIVLKNIHFVGGRHILMSHAYPALNELVDAMLNIPTLEIEIHGHICCQPGEGDGLDLETGTYDLSVQRAKAIYEYLISKGVAKNRMNYKGFGHKYPIYLVEKTDAERMMNRRVEIKIIKK